jgi:hypothetical protein
MCKACKFSAKEIPCRGEQGWLIDSGYSAEVALAVNRCVDGSCVLALADILVTDLMIKLARDATQTQKDFFDAATLRGWDPMPTKMMTVRTVAKIANRRIGLPSDERYGGWVMGVPQNFSFKYQHAMGQNT